MSTYNEILDSWQTGEIRNLTRAGQYDKERTAEAIKREKELFESAAKFSKKLGDKLEQDKEIAAWEADNDAIADEYVEALNLHQKLDKPILSTEEEEAYNKVKKEVDDNERKSKEVSAKVLQNGGTQEQATNIANTSGAISYKTASTRSALLGKEYAGHLEGEMSTNDTLELMLNGVTFTPKTAQTPKQKDAARNAILRQYIKDNDLYYNKALLAEKNGFYSQVLDAHNAAAKRDTRDFAIEQGTIDVETATQEFSINSNYVNLITSLQATTDPKSKPPKGYTRTGAHDKAMEVVKKEMDLGRLQPDEFEESMKALIEDPPGSGKFVMIKDKIPRRYLEMKQHMDQAIVDQQEADDDKKRAAFEDAQEDIFKTIQQQLKDDPTRVDQRYLIGLKTDLLQNEDFFGMEPTKLNKYIENQSPGALEQSNEEAKVLDMIDKNELTTVALYDTGDAQLIEKYKSKAAIIDTIVSKHKKKDTEYLRGLVKSRRRTLGFSEGEGNEDAMADYLVGQIYNNALTAAINAEEANPSAYARQVAEEWFDTYNSATNPPNTDSVKGFKVPGFNDSPADLSAATNRVTRRNKINKRINGVLRRNRDVNSLFTPENINKVMTKERFEEAYTNHLATQDDPRYPQEVNTIFNSQPAGTISKQQILEKIAKAHGIPLPSPSPSLDLTDRWLSKEDHITMEYSGFNGSTRILGKLGQNTDNLNIAFVLNNKGEELFNYSKENGNEFGQLAGTYELFITNPNIAAAYGVTPKSTSGEIDWDRVGLAAAHINGQIMGGFQMGADAYKQVFRVVTSRLNQFRKDTSIEVNKLMDEAIEGKPLDEQLEEIVQFAEIASGKATGDFLAELITTGVVNFSKWSSDRVNDLMNEIIPNVPILNEDEKQNVQQANYKYEPTPKNLSQLVRPGFYGQ